MAIVSARGVPLRERSASDIKAALKGKDNFTIEQFVALHAHAREKHLGLTQLCNQAHISTGILSPCFNGTYTGDYSAIAERIKTFFWRLEQKARYGGLREFQRLHLTNALWQVFEKIRIIRRIQIVQGPEQVGKTRAAVEYTEQNNSGRTVYVQLSGGSKSGCGDFIWSLSESLDIPVSVQSRERRIRIRNKLACCDLILIDEAHLAFTWNDRAQAEFWDYIRTDIFDNGTRGVVLLATNSDLLSTLQVWRTRAKYNVGQLLGRMRNDVMEIDPVDDIVEADVELLIGRYYKPATPGRTVLRKLHAIAVTEQLGHYGLLEDIMNEAWTRAKAAKQKISDKIVSETASEIIATLKNRKELYKS